MDENVYRLLMSMDKMHQLLSRVESLASRVANEVLQGGDLSAVERDAVALRQHSVQARASALDQFMPVLLATLRAVAIKRSI